MRSLSLFFLIIAIICSVMACSKKESFQIKVTKLERTRSWLPVGPVDGENMTISLRYGASIMMKDGKSEFRSIPEYEFVTLHLEIKRLTEGTNIHLEELCVFDSEGETYKSPIGNYAPLGNSPKESRQFTFLVPKDTILDKLQLSQEVFIDLVKK